MRIYRLAALLCLSLLLAAGPTQAKEVKLEPQAVLDGKLILLVPASFEEMSEELRRLKYPSERRPPIVFTNYMGTVNIAVKPTEHRITEASMESARLSMERGFKAAYPGSEIISLPVELDGKLGFFFDFWVSAVDTDIRNWIVGVSVEDRLVMISFNVTRELEPEWMTVADSIMASIDIIE
jgi:hypothetical protein